MVRSYNSFFDPQGPWGRGWALDLPRLETIRIPIERKGNSMRFQLGYELISPLNSLYARFARSEPVAALNGSRLMVADQDSDFFGLADAKPVFLTAPTHKLIRKDGGAWHFGQSGGLVASESNGVRTVYERDSAGRLTRIVGLIGRRPAGFIDLTYDSAGRLVSAQGRRADNKGRSRVRYGYLPNGRLATVTNPFDWRGYRYEGARVIAVTYGSGEPDAEGRGGLPLLALEYDDRGRLVSQTSADGTRRDYRIDADADGKRLTMTPKGENMKKASIRYDEALRPLEAHAGDGTITRWQYPAPGETLMEIGQDDGDVALRVTTSADRRGIEIGDHYRIESQYDTAGRMTALQENDQTLLRQEWSPTGRLRRASNESSSEQYEYDEDGLLSRVLYTPPDEKGRQHWREIRLDLEGRPRKIADARGLDQEIDYDDVGRLRGMITRRDGKAYGFQIERDPSGRVKDIRSTWGSQQYGYDDTGRLTTMTLNTGDQSATAHWGNGLLRRTRQFDGGEVTLAYYDEADGHSHRGLLKQVTTPNRLSLNYHYDDLGQLTRIDVGKRLHMLLRYDDEGRLEGWGYRPAGK